jgi:hypothetical protein
MIITERRELVEELVCNHGKIHQQDGIESPARESTTADHIIDKDHIDPDDDDNDL